MCLSTDECIKMMWYPHIQTSTHTCTCACMHRNINKPEKRISWLEGKFAICRNMDGLGGFYAGKINAIDITYM